MVTNNVGQNSINLEEWEEPIAYLTKHGLTPTTLMKAVRAVQDNPDRLDGCFISYSGGKFTIPQNVWRGSGVGSAGTTRTPS